jgi:uncharacterized protein
MACVLGIAYLDGKGVARDEPTGVEWLLKATDADEDEVAAQMMLADCYEKGVGVARDDSKALGWLRRAAAKQDIDAAVLGLGQYLREGKGTADRRPDAAGALAAFRVLADRNVAEGQYELGRCYLLGDCGTPVDVQLGTGLFRRAAAQGHCGAVRVLAEMERAQAPPARAPRAR